MMKTVLISMVAVVFAFHVSGATVDWSNVSGGNWSEPANWSPNQVPGAGDIANIAVAGTYSVVVDVDATIAQLNLGGAGGEQTVAVASKSLTVAISGVISANGVMNVEGTSQFAGMVTVEVGGELNFDGSGTKRIYGLMVVNHGTVNHQDGLLLASSATAITNTGLWDIQGPETIQHFSGTTAPTFSNTGTLRRSGATGEGRISGFALTNEGAIEVDGGDADAAHQL